MHSGSHSVSYAAFKEDGALKFERVTNVQVGGLNVFQVRRINCKHPSNPRCQWLLAFVTSKYCYGKHTVVSLQFFY